MTTCLAVVLVSLLEPPTAGFLGAIRFGSRPHPLRQENQPIPLNDVLSSPWEKAGSTLTAIRQLGRIRNCLRLNLQNCLFYGQTAPRHATLTSHPRRTHIAPM